jgi:transcriptional regulator with XRE-family HTH domain
LKPREFYEARSKSLIKELRESKQVTYRELARRLEAYGVFVSDRVLINRINRGGNSFAFAMMVMDALGADTLDIPKHPKIHPQTTNPAKGGKT